MEKEQNLNFPILELLGRNFAVSFPYEKQTNDGCFLTSTLPYYVGQNIESSLTSLDLNQDSSVAEIEKKLGKEQCLSLGYFYRQYVEPHLCQLSEEDSESLVPGTPDSLPEVNNFSHNANVSLNDSSCCVPLFDEVPKPTVIDFFCMQTQEEEAVKYKAESEISINRIFKLGSISKSDNAHVSPDAAYNGPPLLVMSGFGELGRFGNQVFQYIFLKCCSLVHHSRVQLPPWVGERLFGLKDERIVGQFPAVVEHSDMKANSTFTNTFLNYIKASNDGKDVREIGPEVLDSTQAEMYPLKNVDIWGWFQWHTSYYRPFRQYIYSLFRVAPDLKEYLDREIETKLGALDDSTTTLVGIHIRLGDYKDISASSFGYCAPTSWYLEWLEKIWPQLNNPVLFIASDELETVERDFAQYHPKSCKSLGITMPPNYLSLGADFFPDWYILSQCNVLAISNSTFSFTSCLLNQRKNATFYRAHYKFRIVKMDPWDTEPIVHRETSSSILKNTWDTIQLLYKQQGAKIAAKNVFLQLPLYGIRAAIMNAVLYLKRFHRKRMLEKASFEQESKGTRTKRRKAIS